MLERFVKEHAGEQRVAVRWGPDGRGYLCTPDGDCGDAARKALQWARDAGVPEGDLAAAGTLLNADPAPEEAAGRADSARRRFTAP